jgi:flagellar biosynthesis/type III secretory pathway protein FliH
MTVENIIEKLARKLMPTASPLEFDLALADTWRDLAELKVNVDEAYDDGYDQGYRAGLYEAKEQANEDAFEKGYAEGAREMKKHLKETAHSQ